MKIINIQKPDLVQDLFAVEVPGFTAPTTSASRILSSFDPPNLLAAFKASKEKEIPVEFWPTSNHSTVPILKGEFKNCKKILLRICRDSEGNIESCALVGTVKRICIFRNLADFSLDSNGELNCTREGNQCTEVTREAQCSQFAATADSMLQQIPALASSLNPQAIQQCADWFNNQNDLARMENFLFSPLSFSQYDSYLDFKRKKFRPPAERTSRQRIPEKPLEERPFWILAYPTTELATESFQVPTCSQITAKEVGVPVAYVESLKSLFERRPIWTKTALVCQMLQETPTSPLVKDNKILQKILPIVAFNFTKGPWRRCWVRYGYNPIVQVESKAFQVVMLRNTFLSFDDEACQSESILPDSFPCCPATRAHIFDGKSLSKNLSTFQMCDLEEPACKLLVECTEIVRQVPTIRDGWYPDGFVERVRQVISFKIDFLLKDLNWVNKPVNRLMEKNRYLRKSKPSGEENEEAEDESEESE